VPDVPLEPLQVASLGDRFLLVAALNSHVSGRVADASPVRVRVDPLRPGLESGLGHVSGLEVAASPPPPYCCPYPCPYCTLTLLTTVFSDGPAAGPGRPAARHGRAWGVL
jgi:hypothetical protein